MTVYELFSVLELAIHDGHGGAPVLFDTEARTFNYHMAKVGRAYCHEYDGETMAITLHETTESRKDDAK